MKIRYPGELPALPRPELGGSCRRLAWSLGVVLLGSTTATTHAQAQQYFLDSQQPPAGTTFANGIAAVNDTGNAVGSVQSGADKVAFYWRGATGTRLRNLDGAGSPQSYQANGLNNLADACGSGVDASGFNRAILWSNGVPTELPPLGNAAIDNFSSANAMNDAGLVVGVSELAQTESNYLGAHATSWRGAAITDLGVLAGMFSEAVAVSPAGLVSGVSDARDGNQHGFLWQDGKLTDLGTLIGGSSHGAGVNDAAEVVGASDWGKLQPDGSYPYQHAFLWKAGRMSDLGTLPGGSNSDAAAVNAAGTIVGNSDTPGGAYHAVMWAGGKIVDLQQMMSAQLPPDVLLNSAVSIADSGRIEVTGFNTKTDDVVQYVLSPAIPTRVTLSSTASAASFGQSVKLIATVIADSGPAPSGYVSFMDGAAVIGTARIGTGGLASITTTTLEAGSHALTAKYGGAAPDQSATSPIFTQRVSATTTRTTLSFPSGAVHGQSLPLTATVVPAYGAIVGQVTFKTGTVVLGAATLDARTKQAHLGAVFKTVGKYQVVATYGGSDNFVASASTPIVITVR